MKKNKLLITFSIILILIGASAATYFFYLAPQPSAKRVADSIIIAASLDNTDTISRYGTVDNLDKFVTNSKQRNFKHSSSSKDEQTFYFLYEFTDKQSPKKARVGIANNKLSSLDIGDGIAQLPKDDKEISVAEDKVNEHCLSKNDLNYLDSERLYARNFRAATMIFAPNNSLHYSGKNNGDKLLDRIANFYKNTHTKDYQFVLSGYAPDPEEYQEEYEKQTQLSNNRATKIHDDLVKREISRDRITIKGPTIYNQSPPDSQDNYVNIDVVNNCL